MLLFTSFAYESMSYHMYSHIFIFLYVNSLHDLILLIKLNVFVILPAMYLHYLKRIIGANSTQHCPLISVFW